MAAPTPGSLLDTVDVCNMGCHSGISPQLLSKKQLSFATNLTMRGGKPSTRPAIRKDLLTYPTGESRTITDRTIVGSTQRKFQCASFYQGFGNNKSCLIASIGGRIFRYIVGAIGAPVAVQELTTTDVNDPSLDQAWMFQGEDFLVINDGQSLPWIWDGAALRRSAGPAGGELPPGCMGHYVNGRLVMSLPNRRSYIAGDLVYSKGASGAYNGRDAILKTNENLSILGGAAFAIPINAGPLNAMFSVAIPDTSLGQGPLQIGTSKGVFGVNLPLDSTLWTTLQQPTQVVSLPSKGPRSQNGVVQINADAWYRAQDGLRSFTVARRDFNTWVQTALSFEMEKILPKDTKSLLDFNSAVDFENRFITTCSPYRVEDRGIAHRGLVAIDFNNISSLTTRSQPDYDGLWTGLSILQILTGTFDGEDRCFIFALDANNEICLYEMLTDEASNFDFNGTEDVRIESWLESNALFGREELPEQIRLLQKKISTADLFLEKMSGTIDFVVQYRSDQFPNWTDWKTFSLCVQSCITDPCPNSGEVQELFATYRRLPQPPDTCSPISGRSLRSGYFFQIRLKWTGHAGLNKLLVWSTILEETINTVCAEETCKGMKICGTDYFSYHIE